MLVVRAAAAQPSHPDPKHCAAHHEHTEERDTQGAGTVGLDAASLNVTSVEVANTTRSREYMKPCDKGAWCTAGMTIPCEIGFYANPDLGAPTPQPVAHR